MGDDDDSMSSSMSMTFSTWSTYQIQILFSSWDISTKWQYVLSWFTVVLAVIVYHAMRYWVMGVEAELKLLLLADSPSSNRPLMASIDNDGRGGSGTNTTKILQLRLFHSLLSCLTYGVGDFSICLVFLFHYSPQFPFFRFFSWDSC